MLDPFFVEKEVLDGDLEPAQHTPKNKTKLQFKSGDQIEGMIGISFSYWHEHVFVFKFTTTMNRIVFCYKERKWGITVMELQVK